MTGHTLEADQQNQLLDTLRTRFENNMGRHPDTVWADVLKKLKRSPASMWSLHEMESTGGEPDIITSGSNIILYVDCSPESPAGRRSTCYDREALDSRKEHKPQTSAVEMASHMGIELLSEEQYRHLQTFGKFDNKTSSWIKTPADIRKRGGALFCDRRYGHVFTYHNGAQSYYAARGFRGSLQI